MLCWDDLSGSHSQQTELALKFPSQPLERWMGGVAALPSKRKGHMSPGAQGREEASVHLFLGSFIYFSVCSLTS